MALVLDERAFAEDCERAAILVTPLFAPSACHAPVVIDRRSLGATGAVTLDLSGFEIVQRSARASGEDRPWSRAPRVKARPNAAKPSIAPLDEDATRAGEAESLAESLE